MEQFHEIEQQAVEELCIRSRMKSKIDELKYVFNVNNVEKFIETKELMMMK